MLVAGQGIAGAAPGQPGLAVPGEGQPGLSTSPAPPAASAPSPADWIPDPPVAPPNRPRPQQQTQPDVNTLVQPKPQTTQPDATEPEAVQPQTPNQEVMPSDPHKLRIGTNTVQLPDFIDTKSRDKAQTYLDMAEWQIAAAYDGMGYSREDSDRMAASSTIGALVGVGAAAVAPIALMPGGCVVGAVVGAVAGGAIGGLPTAGIGAPAGAIIGGAGGCVIGASIGGLISGPVVIGTASLAALAGKWLSGGDATKPPPVDPTTVDQPFVAPVSAPVSPIVPAVAPIQAAQPVYDAVAPVIQQAAPIVNQVTTQVTQTVDQVVQSVETTVDSLRSAVTQMPPLTPENFLAALAPAPGA
ncbi:hypothetical protein GFY24_36775 [Nocardia sp. SYP-A9097]|uniref:hypothetical protein n=1 Tax=Nocardia sp. SYP-A9097 TaxID=2663237 RepID=UPI00129B6D44|nr:hypothetical protein [Nocardia sp. SYP-A9097]MRH92911.1 hypothetical protein [Nocardia sp. SYP-A9097]